MFNPVESGLPPHLSRAWLRIATRERKMYAETVRMFAGVPYLGHGRVRPHPSYDDGSSLLSRFLGPSKFGQAQCVEGVHKTECLYMR